MINEDYLEPETIRMLKGESATSLEVLKELVIKVLQNTVAPFTDFYVFENVVHILNDIEPDVDKIEGTTPEQIWYALEKIKEIIGDYPELDDEVETYIRFAFKNAGCSFYPPSLEQDPLNLAAVQKRAEGPYPIIATDNPLDVQAVKYLRIMEYLDVNRSI